MRAQDSTLVQPETRSEKWYIIDAQGQILGRFAARVAKLVKGKLAPIYSPHLNPKIHVVILNADKVVLTGKKVTQKTYYHHSGWRTGVKATTPERLLEEKPTEIVRKAIHGMLPKNRLGVALNKNIRIYAGSEHPHGAQAPESLEIRTRRPKARF